MAPSRSPMKKRRTHRRLAVDMSSAATASIAVLFTPLPTLPGSHAFYGRMAPTIWMRH